MYLFPQIDMPEKAIQKAKELGKPADVMYALELLGKSLDRLVRIRVQALTLVVGSQTLPVSVQLPGPGSARRMERIISV